jgi:hypothetical protein
VRHTTWRVSLKAEGVEEKGRSCSNERRDIVRCPCLRATGRSLVAIAGESVVSRPNLMFYDQGQEFAPIGLLVISVWAWVVRNGVEGTAVVR